MLALVPARIPMFNLYTSRIVVVTKLHSLTQRNSEPNNCAGMYKATNLAIHRTGLPIENKERLVGGAYHISTKYAALYYRSIRITPFGEMWWCCLSHTCYHFHFSCKDRRISFCFVVLHLRSLLCKKFKEKIF